MMHLDSVWFMSCLCPWTATSASSWIRSAVLPRRGRLDMITKTQENAAGLVYCS